MYSNYFEILDMAGISSKKSIPFLALVNCTGLTAKCLLFYIKKK